MHTIWVLAFQASEFRLLLLFFYSDRLRRRAEMRHVRLDCL